MNSGGSRHHHLALPALPYPHYGLLGDPSQPPPPHSLFHHHPSSLAAVMSSPSDGRNGSGGGGVEEEDEEDEEEEDNGNNREEEEFEAEDDGIGEGDIVQEANNHNHNHNHSHSHSHNRNHRSIPNGNVINPNPNSNSNSNPNLKPKPKPKPNSNLNPNPIRSFEPKFPSPQYRECLKNHAASIGGHALDGCGEFMYPSDNTLCCSACGCHRNFHRREADADTDAGANPCFECGTDRQKNRRIYHYNHHGGQTVMSFNSPQTPSPSPPSNLNSPNHHYSYQHQYQHHHPAVASLRKRFRTKFTSEQKDRMLHFAEKVDWKIHKSDEAAVDAFSTEVGIKRSILKVWMHNNKNTLGKKQCNNLNNNGSRQWADDDAMVEMEAPSTYSNSYPQQSKRTFSSGIHDGGNTDNGNNNMLVGMQEHDCSSGNTDRVDSSIKGGDCRSPHGDKSWDDCHLFDVHLVGPSASSLPQLESEQHSST